MAARRMGAPRETAFGRAFTTRPTAGKLKAADFNAKGQVRRARAQRRLHSGVMAGLVPATHEHRMDQAIMGRPDKLGDDGRGKAQGWQRALGEPWRSWR
jgi:hypothetical protein